MRGCGGGQPPQNVSGSSIVPTRGSEEPKNVNGFHLNPGYAPLAGKSFDEAGAWALSGQTTGGRVPAPQPGCHRDPPLHSVQKDDDAPGPDYVLWYLRGVSSRALTSRTAAW